MRVDEFYTPVSSYFPDEPDIINFIRTNRFEEALKLCARMIESRDSFGRADNRQRRKGYIHRADCYKKMKEYEKAINDYTQIIQAINDKYSYEYEEFYHLRALCYQEMRQYDNALKDHSEAIKCNRRHKGVYPDIYFKYRADCYKEMGEYQKANTDYERAIKNYTKEIEGWTTNSLYYEYAMRSEEKTYALRADCYKSMGKTTEAIKDYTKLIEGNEITLDPNCSKFKDVVINYYLGRGDCYKNLKQYNKAIEDYTSAIKLNSDNSEYYVKRAECYVELKKYNSALDGYSKAIEIYPYDWNYYYNRAMCYWELGDFDKMQDDCNYLLSNSDKKLYNVNIKKCQLLNEKLKSISTNLVEIKTCTKRELMSIEGINSAMADKIIEQRNNGAMWYNIETFANDFKISSQQISSMQDRLVFPLKQRAIIGRKLDL